MNIFVSDECPKLSALNLDDKRLIKMILETAQLLSTAIIVNGGSAPYKATHLKHPATIWTAKSKGNFQWLLNHGLELSNEYSYRFNKQHKSLEVFNYIIENNLINHIPNGDLETFANCTANESKGISFKHINDPVLAYREYLVARWNTDTRLPKWTGRNNPEWYGGIHA